MRETLVFSARTKTTAKPSVSRRIRNALLAALLGLAVTALALEAGLRFLVLGDSSIARRFGESLRRPGYFADGRSDDNYWKLQYLFLDESRQKPANHPDPVCGWISGVRKGLDQTAGLPDLVHLAGQRPVLLYGDSFAQCTTSPEDCFQGILERTDLAERYCLVNYGVGGYGVDQIYLYLRQSIDLWRELDPIVIVSFLVDDDFDRNVLGFRCWPKPMLSIIDDRLVSDGPVIGDPDEYLARNPPRIKSYLYRYLAFRGKALPASWQAVLRRGFQRGADKVALGKKLLEEIHRELESRNLSHFFVAFQGKESLAGAEHCRWAEELVDETAAELGVPVIHTGPFLRAAGGDEGTGRFFNASSMQGHYNDLGNLVAFEAIRSGIEGRFDAVDPARSSALVTRVRALESDRQVASTLLGRDAMVRTRGSIGFARFSSMPYPPFDAGGGRSGPGYLLLRVGENGPTEVHWTLDAGNRRLRGKAMSVARPGLAGEPGELILSVMVDGRGVVRTSLPFYPASVDLDVDLTGASELAILAESTDADPRNAWIHIADVGIQ